MEKHPDCITQPGHKGDLPLHHVCKTCLSDLSLIKDLFGAFPGAIHSKNTEGCLPVHFLFSWHIMPTRDVFHFLVTQLLYAVRDQDSEGRVPAHCACSN